MEKIKKFFNFKEMSKQKKILIIAGLACAIILAFLLMSKVRWSSSNSDGIKVIPKNTVGVAIIDLGSLYDKADVEELLELELVKDGLKFADQMSGDMPFNDIIKDPNESGIDLHSEIFIFSSVTIKEQYVCASIGIDDEGKFNKLIKDLDNLGIIEFDIKENKKEDYQYLVADNYGESFGLAWDNEALLFITSPERRVDEDDIEDELERLMTLESEDRITDNDNFNDFYSDRTDICAWVSSDLVEDMVPASVSNAVMEEMSDKLEDEFGIDIDLSFDDLLGNSAAYFFNFGEGNISIKAGLYLNDKMQEVVEEFTGIVPEELSIEYIVTFDASGRNSLNAIIMTIYNITEKFGKKLIKEAIDDGLDFDFGGGDKKSADKEKEDRHERYK